MRDRREQEKIKALLWRAYALGYQAGYYRHYESVGWIKRELRKIEEMAEALGIKEKAMEIYRKGKLDGERKRSILLIGEEGAKEGRIRKRIFTYEVRRSPISRIILSWKGHIIPHFIRVPAFLRRRNQF